MLAVVTTGNGGFERLEIQSIPIPELGPGEVLLQVLAAGVNNTDINTRVGWYASTVVLGTEVLVGGATLVVGGATGAGSTFGTGAGATGARTASGSSGIGGRAKCWPG